MDEQTIQRFWQHYALGHARAGWLREPFRRGYNKLSTNYDRFRFDPHEGPGGDGSASP
jgi:hypothetical protein